MYKLIFVSMLVGVGLVDAFPGMAENIHEPQTRRSWGDDLDSVKSFFGDILSRRATKGGFPSFPGFPSPPAPAPCPAVWFDISSQLTSLFLDSDSGQCTDAARAAIRAGFHDAGTYSKSLPVVAPASGGADGSLILAQEYLRPENNGLQNISLTLQAIQQQHNNVGMADLIQFAAAHATKTCPLGPVVQVFVGRTDSSNPSPTGLLPAASDSGATILSRFQDMGFTAGELAALVGAHTCAKQFFTDPALAGEALDSTPGVWDVDFYSDVGSTPQGVFVLQSDASLSTTPQVQPAFDSFINNPIGWAAAFAPAMSKLSLNGIPTGSSGLVDCTAALLL